MRQKNQSAGDANFRTALENMHYKSCTDEDIQLLQSRIAGPGPSQPKLAASQFRHVSVITARNIHRDKINEMGCAKFAQDIGEALTGFYSVDNWKSTETGKSSKRSTKKHIDPLRSSNKIPESLQEKLWSLPHSASKNHPGKLSLCIGMPVMIKYNEATECCVTNGAEAVVVGWKSHLIAEDRETLDTLFVKLVNPPKNIQLDGLPENVVPISKHAMCIPCDLPNDSVVRVSREQVPVLPNFAMTDYASQGRTRPYNVVDMNNCRSHQSMYTCLSRGSSLDGTVLVQGFDPRKIQGGMTGYLRQEFRELEIMDEITTLRYHSKLPNHINASTRHSLIRQYQVWKGVEHVPKHVHSSLRWNKSDPMYLVEEQNEASWRLLKKEKKEINKIEGQVVTKKRSAASMANSTSSSYMTAQGTKALQVASHDLGSRPRKKQKISETASSSQPRPTGLVWNAETLTCAYDSLLTILHSIQQEEPDKWEDDFSNFNEHFQTLSQGWSENSQKTLEDVRDDTQLSLSQKDPESFPMSHEIGTDLYALCEEVFSASSCDISEEVTCQTCNLTSRDTHRSSVYWKLSGTGRNSIQAQFLKNLDCELNEQCMHCGSPMHKGTDFNPTLPPILAFSLIQGNLKVTPAIEVSKNGRKVRYQLKGIIYHGGYHFTARVVTSQGDVWYHDGMTTARECKYEGKLSELTDIRDAEGRKISTVIYSL